MLERDVKTHVKLSMGIGYGIGFTLAKKGWHIGQEPKSNVFN